MRQRVGVLYTEHPVSACRYSHAVDGKRNLRWSGCHLGRDETGDRFSAARRVLPEQQSGRICCVQARDLELELVEQVEAAFPLAVLLFVASVLLLSFVSRARAGADRTEAARRSRGTQSEAARGRRVRRPDRGFSSTRFVVLPRLMARLGGEGRRVKERCRLRSAANTLGPPTSLELSPGR